jgi:hypothetical protein
MVINKCFRKGCNRVIEFQIEEGGKVLMSCLECLPYRYRIIAEFGASFLTDRFLNDFAINTQKEGGSIRGDIGDSSDFRMNRRMYTRKHRWSNTKRAESHVFFKNGNQVVFKIQEKKSSSSRMGDSQLIDLKDSGKLKYIVLNI